MAAFLSPYVTWGVLSCQYWSRMFKINYIYGLALYDGFVATFCWFFVTCCHLFIFVWVATFLQLFATFLSPAVTVFRLRLGIIFIYLFLVAYVVTNFATKYGATFCYFFCHLLSPNQKIWKYFAKKVW